MNQLPASGSRNKPKLASRLAFADTKGMFTGIITNTTTIQNSQSGANGLTLTFARPKSWVDMQLGESIATNGVCLTVSTLHNDSYDCFLMPETLAKTSFSDKIPQTVNLERPMLASDRFGGHFVQGHVDGVGSVQRIDENDGWRLTIDFPTEFADLVIPKGSITINGVSLTVVDANKDSFSVAIIPHTLEHTTLGQLLPADAVNLEFDMIGKYIVNIMQHRENQENHN